MQERPNLLFNPPSGKLWGRLSGRRVLVAFSGGKDSLALIHYMAAYADKCSWELTACHINHNLRGQESLRDENFCRDWCLKKNIPFIAVNADVYSSEEFKSRGMEHAARSVRYKALAFEADKLGACVVTAHTFDDQLESFFVDLITGASIYTLGGITPELEGDTVFIRPFLSVSTDMIMQYLEKHGQQAVYDSSNSDSRYVRNYVRGELLPRFAEVRESLQNNVIRIQEESRRLNELFDKNTRRFVSYSGGVALIQRDYLDKAAEVEQRYIIGKWVSVLTRGGSVHVDAIMEKLGSGRSLRLSLPQNYLCEVTPRSLRLFPRAKVACFRYESAKSETVLSDGTVVTVEGANSFIIRSRKPGDRYNGRKIKDLFEKYKIDPYDRDRTVVIEADGQILAVEGLPETQKSGIKVVVKRI